MIKFLCPSKEHENKQKTKFTGYSSGLTSKEYLKDYPLSSTSEGEKLKGRNSVCK
jgi:hypothetical protein